MQEPKSLFSSLADKFRNAVDKVSNVGDVITQLLTMVYYFIALATIEKFINVTTLISELGS